MRRVFNFINFSKLNKNDSSKECKTCINSSINPSVAIGKNEICNVCELYKKKFDKNKLDEELSFFKGLIKNKKYDIMVGISGGKDSTATLINVKKMGFTPLAFTFDTGYIDENVFDKAESIANKLDIDFEKIDIRKYINKTDRESFMKMADLYDKKESENLSKNFRALYEEGRDYYSTKSKIFFSFVRPCQVCRKVVVKAYCAEASKRGIKAVVIGINEWTGLSGNKFTAIRKMQPFINKPPIYIVHLPFLLQQKLEDTKKIIKKINWKKEKDSKLVDTGGSSCMLTRACDKKAYNLLGFHLDSARLARENTVGFITKKQAKKALSNFKTTTISVRSVLKKAKIL